MTKAQLIGPETGCRPEVHMCPAACDAIRWPPLPLSHDLSYPAGASGAPSQPQVVVGQMAVRVVAHKPGGGRQLLMEDK